jgi:hypothetical protein
VFESCSRPLLKHEVITHQQQQFGGPNGIRTRVSATITFSPIFSNACGTERRSESAQLKHAG